jgi:hypothetical protein
MTGFQMVFLFLTLLVSSDILERLNNGHGLLVTVIGLFAVFVGLVILWLVTANLQRILKLFERLTGRSTVTTSDLTAEMERTDIPIEEIMAAIGVALYMELEEEELSVLTLRHIEQEMSPWVVASRPSTMRQP